MSEQENMDDLLRSKFSERDFPFDEENWAKAEEMIIASRKKEKRRRWFIIFFFGLLIGVISMIPFMLNKSDSLNSNKISLSNKNTNLTSATKSEPTENKETQIKNTPETKTEDVKIVEETKSTTETLPNENKKTEVKTTNTKEEKSSPAEPIEKKVSEKKNPSLVIKNTASEETTPPIKTKPTKTKKEENAQTVVVANAPAPVVVETKTEKSTPVKKEKDKTETPAKVTVAKVDEKNKESKTPENKTKESITQQSDKKDLAPATVVAAGTKNNNPAPETKTFAKETKAPAKETKENIAPVTEATVAAINTSLIKDTSKQTTEVVPQTSVATTNTVAAVEKDSVLPAVTKPEQKTDSLAKVKFGWTLSFDAGINAFGNNIHGISPITGINFTKCITQKWEIGSGIYYTYIPIKFANVSTFTTSTTYDFGSTQKITEIVTEKLHYVMAPLFVKYNFNEKNSVVVGANFFYLFNSSGIISTYDLTYSGKEENKSSQKANGYYNAFNIFDVGIMVGYKRVLFGKFGITISLNNSITDIQKNKYTGGPALRNISGQLTLTYKLSK
jgi:hypothetical protein